MYFRLDKDSNILDCGDKKYAEDCLFSKDKIDRAFDGSLMFVSDMETDEYLVRKKEKEEKDYVVALRVDRERECFSVVNRGKLWYDNLSNDEVEELNVWYKAWLDVTQTKQKPKKPSFI